MSAQAAWLADPAGTHELRYWDGSTWTEHVVDTGVQAVDALPPGSWAPPAVAVPPPPPPPPPSPTGEPAAGAPAGKGSWKDKLKSAAQQVAQQGKQVADQARGAIGEQQAKKLEQWKNDPDTLWSGQSQTAAGKATGMAKAMYRITKDRIWIDTGVLGVRSEHVPMWAVKDIDVRQNVMQRSKDVGDVVLWLEDPLYGVSQGNAYGLTGTVEPGGGHTKGEVVLDNIEGPYQVRDLLMPLVSEARSKKMMERQSQFLHVHPGAAGVSPGAPAPAPANPSPPVDLADQLRKLADMRDQGVLTEEEFAAQKAKLLGT